MRGDPPVLWRMSLVVQGLDFERGEDVPVTVGPLETEAGGIQVGLRVGEDRPVILPLQEANQLALNVNETTAERLRVAGERLGDGEL